MTSATTAALLFAFPFVNLAMSKVGSRMRRLHAEFIRTGLNAPLVLDSVAQGFITIEIESRLAEGTTLRCRFPDGGVRSHAVRSPVQTLHGPVLDHRNHAGTPHDPRRTSPLSAGLPPSAFR